jgi:DUF1680 family protein
MPHSRRMRPLPLAKIKITDQFWSRWQRTVAENSLPGQFEQLEATDRFGNLRRCAPPGSGKQNGFYFNDSDVYKWLEAAAYSLATYPNPELKSMVEIAVQIVLDAQMENGYVDSFIQLNHPGMEFRNLGSLHEMYCAGHLIEAGVALFESTGETKLLDAAARFADLLVETFGPGKRAGYCGHEEVELALIKLSRATGKPQYRELALHMVRQRGRRPTPIQTELDDPDAQAMCPGHHNMLVKDGQYVGEYCQDHAPIEEHTKVVGHAVRAMYLYTAVADLAASEEFEPYQAALERCWNNLTTRRMYVTGGVGPSSANEGFTADYDLPNLSAYSETCAACGLIFWGQAMLEASGSSEFADVIERALYNGALSGIGLDGKGYFYDNPLESRGRHQRTPWFVCACCPPNIARLISNLGSYVLGVAEDAVYVNQYVGCVAELEIDGVSVRLEIEAEFPWKGDVRIKVKPARSVEFDLRVRIPEWADDVSSDLPGGDEAEYEDGYAVFRKVWQPGDILTLSLEMLPGWVEANPRVMDDLGRTAMVRGPLVYCAESVDNGFPPQLFTTDIEAEVEEEWSDALHGHIGIRVNGYRMLVEESDELYPPFGTTGEEEGEMRLIPYFAWANRGPSDMQVWLRT